jgi:hypothetical protein
MKGSVVEPGRLKLHFRPGPRRAFFTTQPSDDMNCQREAVLQDRGRAQNGLRLLSRAELGQR